MRFILLIFLLIELSARTAAAQGAVATQGRALSLTEARA